MDSGDSAESAGDFAPAMPLEISQEIAEGLDQILCDYAEDASVETALLVERSGALVTGISENEDVTVEVISALVAGASGAMKSLVRELGSNGGIESLCLSEDRAIYLKEVRNGFVLVGVADSSVPVGILREAAFRVAPQLSDMLMDVNPRELSSKPAPRSLRAMAIERAASRALNQPESEVSSYEEEESEEGDEAQAPVIEKRGREEELDLDRISAEVDEMRRLAEKDEPPVGEEPSSSETEETDPEPVGVVETLDSDEPEVVIEVEDMESLKANSPFELEEEEEEVIQTPIELNAGEPVESIFELAQEAVREEEARKAAVASQAGEGDGDRKIGSLFESDDDAEATESIFEIDDEDSEIAAFETDENEEMESEEESGVTEGRKEENDAQGTGPLYF